MAIYTLDQVIKKSGVKPTDVKSLGIGTSEADSNSDAKPDTFLDRAKKTITTAGEDISNKLKGNPSNGVLDNVRAGTEATATAFNTIPKVAFDAIPSETVRNVLSSIGEVISSAVKAGVDKISDIPQLQSFVTKHPEATKTIENLLGTASAGGQIAGDILSVDQGTKVLQKISDKTIPVIKDTTNKIGEFTNKEVTKLKQMTIDSIDNLKQRITGPDVSEATKVSLNPKEALKNTNQDITVSVGGKLKKLSEITPTENTKIQVSTEKSLENFTKQAEKFAKDRSVSGGSPVEIVGSRTDKALTFADKKRQIIGQKMGDIETKYIGDNLPISEKTLNTFTETLKSIDNPKYGIDTANAPIVKKLVEDFDKLDAGGATIGERLDFVRSWDKYLNDAKDAFGNFKDNATVNTRIQNAIRVLKNETVDAIATKDKIYRNLRVQYKTYKELDEIGNSLLGKDGALGERIKGGATVKRAIQSNSDAGARQFLIKLKELTGYDAIREGDIALTAMENVGDYQGLSLLNILKEGKTGIFNKILEKGQDILVGNKSTRVKNYVKKY